ncbi:MAG: hypothetical protein HQM08_06690 [Candidatus Riflebacteria bacterium]|nr:hypothetical protein [Candidatus Riflebacteria bacterium]
MFSHFSLSDKFKILVWGASAAGLFAICSFFLIFAFFSLREYSVEQISGEASIIAENVTASLAFNDPDSAMKTISALKGDPDITSAWLLLPSKSVFAQYFSKDSKEDSVSHHLTASSGVFLQLDHFDLVKEIHFEDNRFGNLLGTLIISASLSSVWKMLWHFSFLSVIGFLVSMGIINFFTSLMLKKIIRPILLLARTANEISVSKDYSLRTEIENTNDEISLLKNCFFEMLDQIQKEISTRKQAEEGLKRAMEMAESFSFSVSHDLRAPLRAVNGFAVALKEDFNDSLEPDAQEYIERICSGCKKMNELIEAILALSRIERSEYKSSQFDLSEIAKEIDEELRNAEPERKVEFKYPPSLPVLADLTLMKAALQNLLSNAWKYSGKVPISQIELGTIEKDGAIVYFVKDNGAGFDMAYSNKLFGAFQRLHSPKDFQGTGVGLATVQRIIHRHSGKIWAESVINKGATFFFTLPNSTIK